MNCSVGTVCEEHIVDLLGAGEFGKACLNEL
jgi:hypothetical protein